MASFFGKLNCVEEKQSRLLHEATLKILEQVGLYLDHELVLSKLKEFGAQVDFDKKVAKFPPDLVEAKMFRFKNSLDRGLPPETIKFAAGGEMDYVRDLGTDQRRKPTLKDLEDACKVADKLPYIDEVDTCVFLPGIPNEVSDLYTWKTVWTFTGKTGGGGLSRNGNAIQNYSDAGIDYLVRLAAIKAGGIEELKKNPVVGGFIGFASPLRLGRDQLQQMLKLIEVGQFVGIGSNVISGAQAPATISGVVTMENAERLGGLMAALSIDEGARIYFTNHPQYLDMSVGNVSNGSAEHALASLLGRALFKYYGFNRMFVSHPAVCTGSHLPDQQAGLEKMMGMLMAGLGGAKGICALGSLNEEYSLVQLVIDNEIAGIVRRILAGIEITEEDIALDLILEAGIGGNYLEYPEQILEQVRRTYHKPSVLNRSSYAVWSKEENRSITERAREKARELLSRKDHPEYLTKTQIAEMEEVIKEAENRLLKPGM